MQLLNRFDPLIDAALAEDLGVGDVTTAAVVDPDLAGRARIVTREPMIVAGVPLFIRTFQRLDSTVTLVDSEPEGGRLLAGETVARLQGPLASLLSAERVALNFLQRLCGVATLTQTYVNAVPAGCPTKILDTRKTTPGLRALERYAVRCGGGRNHRARLDGGLLIKDNHIAAAGSIAGAVLRAKAAQGPALRVEVEVTNQRELTEALAAGAEVIMLDNMTPEQVEASLKLIRGRALVEVSGSVPVDDVSRLASLGVDFISVGALTHSAPAIDLSMKIEPC